MEPMYWTNPETATKIVDIVASISRYVEKTYNSSPPMSANYSHTQPTMETLDEMATAIAQVRETIKDLEGHPGNYLRAMTKGFAALVRFMNHDGITYREAIRDVLEVELREIPAENFTKTAASIEKTLTEWGYSGTVAEMIAKWQDDKRIPPSEVIPTAHRYLDRCQKYGKERVRNLPESEGIESVNELHNVYFSGLSEYLGDFQGRLSFNIDRPWNAPSFVLVLTHEAYPGHHTYYTLWDYLYQQGKLPKEASYYLIDSPTNCMFEGMPEIAANMLGWDTWDEESPEISKEEKAEIILAKDIMDLQRMLQTNACFFYNDQGWTKEQVMDYMTKDGWYSEIEATNTFNYFSHEYKSLYYPCYYYGRWIMQQAYDRYPRDRREEFFQMIYDTPQTNSTLIAAVAEATGAPFNPFEGI